MRIWIKIMSKCQSSKKARKHRKEAKFAGLPLYTDHPTHIPHQLNKQYVKGATLDQIIENIKEKSNGS